MPLSKIWTKLKKPFVVGLIIAVSVLLCFLILHLSNGAAEVVFTEILGAFSVLAIFGTTLSVALFNYVDNISKDVSALDADDEKISKALAGLSALKKEVIVNAGLILSLLVIELATKGLSKSIASMNIPFDGFYWVVISIRFSLFVLAILAASEQIKGLLVAVEYRGVIHAGKNSKKSAK